jgi:hypothetical protein
MDINYEKILIKKINNNNFDSESIKSYILKNNLCSIRLHCKKTGRLIFKKDRDTFNNKIDELKNKIQSQNIYNSRFNDPLETLQINILNKPVIIDFKNIKEIYKKTKTIPLKTLTYATYDDLIMFLPNDFDPQKYLELNPFLDKLTSTKDIEYHYIKYGRLRNLKYK